MFILNILIVDDEQYIINDLVQSMNWTSLNINNVYTALNVKKAKEILEKEQVQILLCDIEMPQATGLDLLQWVRENKKNVENLFLTCHAEFQYAQTAIRLGSRGYLLKPIDYEELAKHINEISDDIRHRNEETQFSILGKHWDSIVPMDPLYKEHLFSDTEKSKKESKVIAQALAYIQKNIAELPDREAVSNTVFLNPDYLDRLFKKELGISVSKYIAMEKINLAKSLLHNTDFSISDIATKVGYTNLSNFSLMFKKVTGMTPIDFRKNQ